MASRRRAREYALQGLYQADLGGVPVTASLNSLWAGLLEGEGIGEGRPPESEEVEFAQRLAFGVEQHREEIDALIERCSTNWRLPRMPVVDRNVLRMAAFELMACEDIPATVSINEAVELAKRFGTADSRAFVNGIVDRMARQLKRLPERQHG
ncbi:MAG: transcription antitermination factor NusB [Deltaproteobacteria bacterium]|nr:transcription antitermination factor NusB [Deltaproteobacteria bacterium]MBW2255526.1 transcription antitermination factor NusB [Deltaproteobacteria bacterium]